jgi:signal transduction histidine kinase
MGWLIVQQPDPPAVSTLIFWTALLAAVELLPVSLGFGSEVTMGFPIHLALAITFRSQPWVAMLIAGVGALDVREVRGQIPIWRAAFNRSQTMLSVGAAAWVFASFSQSPYNPIVVTGGALVHLAVNLSLVALMVGLHVGVPALQALKELPPKPLLGFGMSYALLTSLGAVTAVVHREIGAWAVAAILIPLLFARLSFLGARKQQELTERVQKQQEALLSASEKVFQEREHERARIAEHIHDSSLQMLAAAAYSSSNALQLLNAGKLDNAARSLSSVREAVDSAIATLRESVVDLRRSSVEEGGLVDTVRSFADQLSTLWGANISVVVDIEDEPPLPVTLAAFQIVQEGMINALKHARSDSVIVRINQEGAMVHLVVEDNGTGFDLEEEVGSDHVGMRLMRERAAGVGGEINIRSEPGQGTRLEALLPGGVSLG